MTIEQVSYLNKRIGAIVYAVDEAGHLVAASVSKRYIKETMIDDLIQGGYLTKRARDMAREMMQDWGQKSSLG